MLGITEEKELVQNFFKILSYNFLYKNVRLKI